MNKNNNRNLNIIVIKNFLNFIYKNFRHLNLD
jgi:hypothetical protein